MRTQRAGQFPGPDRRTGHPLTDHVTRAEHDEPARRRLGEQLVDAEEAGHLVQRRHVGRPVVAQRAVALGAEHIATGHYARIREVEGRFELLKAVDQSKDQSYFLYRLNQAQLSKSLFPLGGTIKTEVREIARKFGLANHDKKDSTGICFIGERPFREFLSRYLPREPGAIETPEGHVVGKHEGLMYYTLGQRKGLGIGGEGEAWYVAGKDLQRNVLIAVQGHDHPALLKRDLVASQLTWIGGDPPVTSQSYAAKTRYRQHDSVCRIAAVDDEACEVEFVAPQWAVTPGQSFVAYQRDVCLGGGIIER